MAVRYALIFSYLVETGTIKDGPNDTCALIDSLHPFVGHVMITLLSSHNLAPVLCDRTRGWPRAVQFDQYSCESRAPGWLFCGHTRHVVAASRFVIGADCAECSLESGPVYSIITSPISP